MKEIIALIVFLIVFGITLYLLINKKISGRFAIALLCFSIISGISISNYDLIQSFKWGGLELATVKKEITDIKDEALKEIKSEVVDQKQSIKLLITNANDSREKIEVQKESLNKLISKAQELQKDIENQKQRIVDLNKSTLVTKTEIENLNKASAQISLSVVRATYFMIETKNEFGGARSKKAIEEILNDLNKMLPMVITDPAKRQKWIQDLQNTLPKRPE
jgi:chromosome segregation ATPase